MTLNKVSVDLPTVLDPHKLLFLIAGLDHTHSEILVPDSFRFIGFLGLSLYPPTTIHVFDDPDFVKSNLDEFFRYSKTSIVPENFIAGLKLLRMAYDKDMITLFDTARYEKMGLEILKTDKYYPDFYKGRVPNVGEITIYPDAVGVTLEALLGIQADRGAMPIFGDLDFVRYLEKKKQTGTILGHTGVIHVDHDLELLLECPQASNLEELFFFATNEEFITNVADKLSFTKKKKTAIKDIGVMGIEFGSTVAIDIALFSGFPVTTGIMFTYKILKRVLYVK